MPGFLFCFLFATSYHFSHTFLPYLSGDGLIFFCFFDACRALSFLLWLKSKNREWSVSLPKLIRNYQDCYPYISVIILEWIAARLDQKVWDGVVNEKLNNTNSRQIQTDSASVKQETPFVISQIRNPRMRREQRHVFYQGDQIPKMVRRAAFWQWLLFESYNSQERLLSRRGVSCYFEPSRRWLQSNPHEYGVLVATWFQRPSTSYPKLYIF